MFNNNVPNNTAQQRVCCPCGMEVFKSINRTKRRCVFNKQWCRECYKGFICIMRDAVEKGLHKQKFDKVLVDLLKLKQSKEIIKELSPKRKRTYNNITVDVPVYKKAKSDTKLDEYYDTIFKSVEQEDNLRQKALNSMSTQSFINPF